MPAAPTPRATETEPSAVAPFNFEEPERPILAGPDREALRSASNWLKAHAGVGIVHLFTCGCVNVLAFGAMISDRFVAGAVLDLLLRLVALGVIAAGADSMERRRSRGLGMTAAVLALLVSGYLMLLPGLLFLASMGLIAASPHVAAGDSSFLCASLGMTILVSAIGFVGGIRALLILNKPEVIQSFRSKL
jgi:hypothetical protein